MDWADSTFKVDKDFAGPYEWAQAMCNACESASLWSRAAMEGAPWRLIHPDASLSGPSPSPHMPTDVLRDFDEARQVAKHSPRAAAALLRLSIQRLCKHLGASGEHINDDIRFMVGQGLPRQAQQALDVVRVVGNQCVHPGSIDDGDLPKVVQKLFDLVNFIVHDRIGRFKELEEMYADLPDGLAAKIDAKDGRAG
jgi:hypothetical protein